MYVRTPSDDKPIALPSGAWLRVRSVRFPSSTTPLSTSSAPPLSVATLSSKLVPSIMACPP
eukprot:2807881-Prymnesium_polylepis.1